MSSIPEANKMLVSLTLKIPLQFEIELQGMQDTKVSQLNYEETLTSAIKTNSDLIIDGINQELAEQILSQINESHLVSDNNGDRKLNLDIEDKSVSNQQAIFTTDKKRKVRLADSLNDSLTLVANVVGTMLFLGKLANYSWE